MSLANKITGAWNAFRGAPEIFNAPNEMIFGDNPQRSDDYVCRSNTLIDSIYNRIALDISNINIFHVRTDLDGNFLEVIDDDLNLCLSLSSNLDQTARAFKQDLFYSCMQEGCIAVVPIDTDVNPNTNDIAKVYSIRVGKITQWSAHDIKVKVYNENTGRKEELWFSKSNSLIIENPFFEIMNKRNSTLQRLLHKMSLLDRMDNNVNSNKLDLIIQLPYVIKGEALKRRAADRQRSIQEQLEKSKYGIAYIDGTEKVTQLNRSLENNLPAQIEKLTAELYSQLCMTPEIMNGTADEKTMTNYYVRVIELFLTVFVDELRRKWFTKTARSQGHSVMFFRDHFELIPVSSLADAADKFTRNEIMTSNEFRQVIGLPPSLEPRANSLQNKNLYSESRPVEEVETVENFEKNEDYKENIYQSSFKHGEFTNLDGTFGDNYEIYRKELSK